MARELLITRTVEQTTVKLAKVGFKDGTPVIELNKEIHQFVNLDETDISKLALKEGMSVVEVVRTSDLYGLPIEEFMKYATPVVRKPTEKPETDTTVKPDYGDAIAPLTDGTSDAPSEGSTDAPSEEAPADGEPAEQATAETPRSRRK